MEDYSKLLKKQGFIQLSSYCYGNKIVCAFIKRRFEQFVMYFSFEYIYIIPKNSVQT